MGTQQTQMAAPLPAYGSMPHSLHSKPSQPRALSHPPYSYPPAIADHWHGSMQPPPPPLHSMHAYMHARYPASAAHMLGGYQPHYPHPSLFSQHAAQYAAEQPAPARLLSLPSLRPPSGAYANLSLPAPPARPSPVSHHRSPPQPPHQRSRLPRSFINPVFEQQQGYYSDSRQLGRYEVVSEMG